MGPKYKNMDRVLCPALGRCFIFLYLDSHGKGYVGFQGCGTSLEGPAISLRFLGHKNSVSFIRSVMGPIPADSHVGIPQNIEDQTKETRLRAQAPKYDV